VKIEGVRRRLPTGPRGSACSSTEKASASTQTRNVFEISAGGAADDQRIDHEDGDDGDMLHSR
jgi:hypothetical protein